MRSTSRSSTKAPPAPKAAPKAAKKPSSLEAPIRGFLQARRIDRGAADRTTEAYGRDLAQFAASLSAQKTLPEVTSEDLTRFLASLHDAQLKAASIARKVSALRQFFKFCCLEGLLEKNPAEGLESPTLTKGLPKALSVEQVSALLAAADEGIPYPGALGDALRARDRAMVYLLYATGLRVSELVGLSLHEIDLEAGYVRVTGKGEKQRIAPFAPVAGEHLHRYLHSFRASLLGDAPAASATHAFLNHRGFVLTRQSFWKLLKQLAVQAGVPVSLSPHGLRHSFATHLLQSGMNLRSLQMLLGHSDLSTTQIYAHVTPEHLKKAHRKYHPRGE